MNARTSSVPILGLILAEAVSLLGNQIAAVGIPVLVLTVTNSPLITAIAGIGNVLPLVLAAVLGGHAVDRLGAWKTSVLADLLSCISVLALPLAFVWLHPVSPVMLFGLVFLGAFFDPAGVSARQSLVPGLARRSGISLQRVNSWRGTLENAADFFGPALAVTLIAALGLYSAFVVNAVSFFLCALLFATTVPRIRRPDSVGARDASWQGARLLFSHEAVRPLALAGMVTSLVVVSFLALLLPVLVTRELGSTTLLGLAVSAFGLAATIGAATFSTLAKHLSYSTIYYGGLVVTGASVILCGFATTGIQVVGLTGLAGLLLGAGNPLQQTVLHEHVPESISGRTYASLSAFHAIAGSVGLLAMGILVERSGIRPVLVMAGATLAGAAVVGRLRLPIAANTVVAPAAASEQ